MPNKVKSVAIVVFAVATTFFVILLDAKSNGDLRLHIQFAYSAGFDYEQWPKHFLYSLLLVLGTFGIRDINLWNYVASFWLGIGVTAKFLASFYVISERHLVEGRKSAVSCKVLFLCILLLVSIPIPSIQGLMVDVHSGTVNSLNVSLLEWVIRGNWYHHAFTPTVWHNSTLIVLMPFAISAFWVGYRVLANPARRLVLLLALLLLISIFAKPSFFLVYFPIFCFLVLVSKLETPAKVRIYTALLLPVSVFLLQCFLIYSPSSGGEIKIGLLEAWLSDASRTFSGFFSAVFLSLLFPIVFYATYPSRFFSRFHQLALGMSALSFLLAGVVSETAGGLTAGNLMWSATSSQYLLYLVCLADIPWSADVVVESRFRRYGRVSCWAVFYIQSVVGTLYVFRYVLTGNYH